MTTPNDLVIVSGGLGRVVRAERSGGADGWLVTRQRLELGDGWLPHWTPDWALKPAVIGGTVCERARWSCPCGLVHLSRDELAGLRGAA